MTNVRQELLWSQSTFPRITSVAAFNNAIDILDTAIAELERCAKEAEKTAEAYDGSEHGELYSFNVGRSTGLWEALQILGHTPGTQS